MITEMQNLLLRLNSRCERNTWVYFSNLLAIVSKSCWSKCNIRKPIHYTFPMLQPITLTSQTARSFSFLFVAHEVNSSKPSAHWNRLSFGDATRPSIFCTTIAYLLSLRERHSQHCLSRSELIVYFKGRVKLSHFGESAIIIKR